MLIRRLFFISFFATMASSSHAASEFYCCQDASSGRRVCGDTLPEQCRGRAYRVLDMGGNVVKEVGPPLTAEQKALQALETQRKKKQDEADREQRRRDQALLDTYTTVEDIDLAQKKAEADVNYFISEANARINALRIKRKKFEDEAEFYKKKTIPAELDRELRSLDHEIRLQQELLDLKKKDFETIKTKYDADRKRYFELTRRPPATSGTAVPGR